jgi:hypothetical protein
MIITKILKPEKFNSTVFARIMFERISRVASFDVLNDEQKQGQIDVAQDILDDLRDKGIIG